MFSNRLWTLKLGAALGLLAWLGEDACRTYSALHPELERVAYDWSDLRDREVNEWGRRVESQVPGGFVIQTWIGPLTVETPSPPPAGAYVHLIARPTGPRTLQAVSLKVSPGYRWKRLVNYVVSLLALGGYLWLVRHRFRWRIQDGVFRSRY